MKITILQHMLMNQQSVSIFPTKDFTDYIQKKTNTANVQLHFPNVYLFQIPPEGEIQNLSVRQKKFIFTEEFSLYEEQFGFEADFSEKNFDNFFSIKWHGVNYHIDIDKL
jgi:hypothetical protein